MFIFKLQVPLDHRKRVEDAARNEYAKAGRELLEETGRLEKMESERQQAVVEYLDAQKRAPDMNTLKLFDDFFSRVKNEMWRQRRVIEEKEREVYSRLKTLLEMAKKKRVLEVFRDKCFEEYCREETRAERRRMDEISATRFVRQANEP